MSFNSKKKSQLVKKSSDANNNTYNNIKKKYNNNNSSNNGIFNKVPGNYYFNLNSLNNKENKLKNNNEKMNYSIFINISNVENKPNLLTLSELSTYKNNSFYKQVYSKKKLNRVLSSSNINSNKYKINDNINGFVGKKNKEDSIIYRNKYNIENIYYKKNKIKFIDNNKNNIKLIIQLQSFIRRFLIRNKIYKNIIMINKLESSIKHINQYHKLLLKKSGVLKSFIGKLKKCPNKKYFVDKEQYELIKILKNNNVHNFNEFKNFVIWCINNDIEEI